MDDHTFHNGPNQFSEFPAGPHDDLVGAVATVRPFFRREDLERAADEDPMFDWGDERPLAERVQAGDTVYSLFDLLLLLGAAVSLASVFISATQVPWYLVPGLGMAGGVLIAVMLHHTQRADILGQFRAIAQHLGSHRTLDS